VGAGQVSESFVFKVSSSLSRNVRNSRVFLFKCHLFYLCGHKAQEGGGGAGGGGVHRLTFLW